MARLLRVEYKGAIYHVTVRSNSGVALYRDDQDREYWLYRLGKSIDRHGVRVHLYCQMGNHFHLLVETPRGNLGRFMHSLLTGYTVFFNRRHQTHGHVTQGRYGAKLVAGDDYLLKLSRYIHLNPVKVAGTQELPLAERIKTLRDYKWSSYPAYAGLRAVPEWLVTKPLLALGAGPVSRQRRQYQEYVEAGVAEDDVEFQTELMRSAQSIGDADFRAEVDERYAQLVQTARRPEDAALRRVAPGGMSGETILATVAEAAGVGVEELRRRHRGSALKPVAATLLLRHAGLTQRDIAPLIGLNSGSSVSSLIRRLPHIGKIDGQVDKLMAAAERLITSKKA